MSDTREVKVNLIAQATGYVAGMEQAARKTRELGSEAEKLAKKAASFRQLGQAGVAVGVAILGVGAAALKTGIAYNTLQQTSRAALKTLLGSAAEANAQMDKLDLFARTSPFAKQVFITAQQQMLGFGVAAKNVIPALDAIQNAVAAMGGSNEQIAAISEILSRIKSEGRLSGDALQRLGYYGIDAAEVIGSQMGKTALEIRDMASKPGGIPVDQIWDPLVNGLQAKFGGAAANVKQTFAGATDRMKAAWRDFAGELARPLVDPNGGGALIDLFNWTADMMRAFIALPEPVKTTTIELVATVGVVALLGGAALLAVPKIAAIKVGMAELGITVAGARAKLVATAGFLTGPWVAGIAIATLGVQAFANYLKSLEASSAELTNSLLTARSAADVFATASKGKQPGWWTDVFADLKDLPDVLNAADDQAKNVFARFDKTHFGAFDALKDIGTELGALATRDLPSAQRAFSLLADKTDGSKKQLNRLLEQMPDYKQALIEQANEQGIQIAGLSDAEVATKLLKLATGDGTNATKDNAAALAKLSGVAQGANVDISDLAKSILNFGKGQLDVNSAQRDFQAAIDDATASIKENGKSLDIGTEAGRRNGEAVDNIAKTALAAASAILTQTGSQEDATKAIQDGRDAVIATRRALGDSAGAAAAFADGLGLIPSNVGVAIELNTDPATLALNKFIADITGRRPTLFVQGKVLQPGGVAFNYQGGLYERGMKAFAAGGFASGIYKGVDGGIHKFAEREMGVPWEAYISGRASDRDRNLAIWAETGARLGAMQSAPSGNAMMSPVTSGANLQADRPIQMDGSLFGVLRTLANGEAKIVLNTSVSRAYAGLVGRPS